jgi:site-specific recombinase XerD
MTELREKMIRALELRNLSKQSKKSYLNAVTGISRYYNQSPDQLTKEMIEDYLLYLKKEKKCALTTVGTIITGLRFFYINVVGNEQLAPSCNFAKTPRSLPTVLSPKEIFRIIDATDNLKHRVMLMATYSAGLRASETLSLKPEHIDSERMLIKVTGKGDKQRYSLLSKKLLPELRDYYKQYRPEVYLFPSPNKSTPLSYAAINAVYSKARKKAGLKKGAGIHTMRHYVELQIMPSSHVCITPNILFFLSLFIHTPLDYSA